MAACIIYLGVDEWQHVSFIWDQVKYEVDKTGEFGQYILTGSVTDKSRTELDDESSRHTGNGRIIRKMMRTMSLYETGDSNGTVSLLDLKNGIFSKAMSKKDINDYAYYVCRGGWPVAIGKDREVSLAQARDYYEVVVTDDIFSLKDIPLKKDEQKARKLMRSYARNVSIAAADTTLLTDCVGSDDTFDKDVFAKYLNALRNLYVIEEPQKPDSHQDKRDKAFYGSFHRCCSFRHNSGGDIQGYNDIRIAV